MTISYRKHGCICKAKKCTCGAKWEYRIDVGIDPKTGKRTQKIKGGFSSRTDAVTAAELTLGIKDLMTIFETHDYSKFKKIPENRFVSKKYVAFLMDSMKQKYICIPICINKDFEIIDGQHRYEAIMQLELPLYFFICEDYGLKEALFFQNMGNKLKLE